jgi:hypothetical protein
MKITRKNHQCRRGLDRGVGGDLLSRDCQLVTHYGSISTTRFPAVSGPPTQGLRGRQISVQRMAAYGTGQILSEFPSQARKRIFHVPD